MNKEELIFLDEETTAMTIKAGLIWRFQSLLKGMPGNQSVLAVQLNIPQPKISNNLNGKMFGFSIERLANLLLRLNYYICLKVHPANPQKTGRVINQSNNFAV